MLISIFIHAHINILCPNVYQYHVKRNLSLLILCFGSSNLIHVCTRSLYTLVHFLLALLKVMVYLQLKEMVLALLHESDLVLSDDIVETIVNKVHKIFHLTTFKSSLKLVFLMLYTFFHRLLVMLMQKVMEGSIRMSGKHLYLNIHP